MVNITLQNILKRYSSSGSITHAVDDVSLSIAPGEFFFLLGPSGCGKTTLLRIIAGLIEPTAGSVRFGDRDVTDLPTERRNVALVFQNYALWPHMTVQDNVEFGPRMQGKDRATRRSVARSQLELVQMHELANRKPNQLSGGQQQRVALARALAAQSQALLLDEPLSNLDARLRQHMRLELRQLVKASGVTAVYVTHDQAEALSMADRIAVMNAGKVVQLGTPRELYEQPATRFVADFLGEANFIPCQAKAATDGTTPIVTPAGTLHSSRRVPAGAELTCCVRPEKIRVVARQAATEGLAATVIGTTYLGHMHQYACRLADGTTWRATALGTSQSLPENAPVTLTVDAQDVIILSN